MNTIENPSRASPTASQGAAPGKYAPNRILSIAIIAHVDHGKTTLVDKLLSSSGIFRSNEEVVTCVMDSNDLERERGITILAKPTAIEYNDYFINIIDTPGHADFGGEVQRILGMVDSAILIVDAAEGPMPQTRFVLRNALTQGLKVLVVINKIDRGKVDPMVALNKVFDLFLELGATDEQALFPSCFASGTQGVAKLDMKDEALDMRPLLDLIVANCAPSGGDPDASLQMQVSILDYSPYVGRMGIGRIKQGTVSVGQTVVLLKENGVVVRSKVTKILKFLGVKRVEAEKAWAGEIVAIAGIDEVNVSDTIASPDAPNALPRIQVDEPTLNLTFLVNDSPFAGKEGKFVTSRQLSARLLRELETNVSLRVADTDNTGAFKVSGRGELHLGILMETMRREGFEFAVSRPEVILKTIDGQECEPYEKLLIDVEEQYSGSVIQELAQRRVDLTDVQMNGMRSLLEFIGPTRGLLGLHSRLPELTKGDAVIHQSFLEYRPTCGDIPRHRPGVLTAWETGEATEYALSGAEDRGVFFITPGTKVYGGMIVGENTRAQDLGINVCKTKKLTNIRTTASEGITILTPPRKLTLERCLAYIDTDELVEVTPVSIRMRKRALPNR